MKKILEIAIVSGLIEAAIMIYLMEEKTKWKMFVIAFLLYALSYIIITEMEIKLHPEEDEDIKCRYQKFF